MNKDWCSYTLRPLGKRGVERKSVGKKMMMIGWIGFGRKKAVAFGTKKHMEEKVQRRYNN